MDCKNSQACTWEQWLRNVNRERDRCIFYSTWVKRVCCVSEISSDCGCQSKEIGVGMEVRLLSVGTWGFFLTASRLAIAASPLNSVAPNEKKTSGTRVLQPCHWVKTSGGAWERGWGVDTKYCHPRRLTNQKRPQANLLQIRLRF